MRSAQTPDLLERLRRATIGRYDVYAELGQGGMATVYLALDLALDRKVAIKVLNPTLATSADNVERFKREAKVAASLNHPNIIGIYAVGDDPELAYFVMKYIEGRALDSVVRESGAQSLPFVRGVIASAGKALHYAHTRGVVHRDVKPANFMLDKDGWLVVTDFGIAKMDDAKGLTLTGSVIGTPYYMAPEQFQGKPVTAAADQYALGVVAFELLTGRQPFAGETIGEVMKGHLFDPVPSLRSLRPDVPEHVESAVTRMLAKDAAERFPTLDDAVEAFGLVTPTQEQEVRTQIINLASSGAMQQPQISVPLSPAPLGRDRAEPKRESAAHSARTRSIAAHPAHTPPIAPPTPGAGGESHRMRTGILVTLALLIGGVAATAFLRPDLVTQARARLLGPPGVSADSTNLAGGQPLPVLPTDSASAGDSAQREQSLRDSLQREIAQALRDSIARVDSARRADSLVNLAAVQRADSIRRERARARTGAGVAIVPVPGGAGNRPSGSARQTIRDSLQARREARNAAQREQAVTPVDTAVPAPAPPLQIPSEMIYGRIYIGSRCEGAELSIEGGPQAQPISGLRNIEHISGPVRLRVRTRRGVPWDTAFTVEAGVQHRIGYRPVIC